MKQGIFTPGLPLLFVLLGFSLITDENWQFPDGDFTFKNYVGMVVIAFFGTLAVLSIVKLISGGTRAKK